MRTRFPYIAFLFIFRLNFQQERGTNVPRNSLNMNPSFERLRHTNALTSCGNTCICDRTNGTTRNDTPLVSQLRHGHRILSWGLSQRSTWVLAIITLLTTLWSILVRYYISSLHGSDHWKILTKTTFGTFLRQKTVNQKAEGNYHGSGWQKVLQVMTIDDVGLQEGM